MNKRIVSYLVTLSIILSTTGCNKKNIATIPTNNDNSIEYLYDSKFLEQDGNFLFCNKYLKEIDSIPVSYNYDSYYFNDNEYNHLINIMNSKTKCTNTEIKTIDDVYINILNNSNLLNKTNLTEKEKVISESLNKALYNIYSNHKEIGDDFCKLKDITILIGHLEGNTLGNYNDRNKIIIIDYDKIKKEYNESWTDEDFITYFTKTVEHELNHVRQFICNCRKNSGQLNDTIDFENSLTIIEASAESQLYFEELYEGINYEIVNSNYCYVNERSGQSLLLLIGLFKDNFTLIKYYEAINNSDVESLLNLFDLKNKEDIITFYKIKGAIDTLNKNSIFYDYLNLSLNGYNEIKDAVGNAYKIDIFKIVIKDLIKTINQKDLNLDTSIRLYCFVKSNIINAEANYEIEEGIHFESYDEDFLNSINEIEKIFYSFLIKRYKIDINEINMLMNDWEFLRTIDYIIQFSTINPENNLLNDKVSYEKTKNIVDKFPLIKEISFANATYSYYLKSFNTATEKKYIKK